MAAKSLFEQAEADNLQRAQPLAARMRPATLDEFVGQQHFLGEGKLLRRLLKADRLGSVIFYGPPGTGKTTLARLLATESRRRFRQLSAVTSGVKELREVLAEARDELATGGRKTLLFIDEIHRFNKAQQDVLLPDVEEGIVILVGATTANPFFAVNSALVSRSQIFQFEPLSPDEIKTLLRRALADKQRGLGQHQVRLHDDALEFLAEVCDGDARRALSALEVGVLSSDQRPLEFTRQLAEESVQRKAVEYDATGDAHYDTASALIKSIRGSDPDAALYWLARMLEGGRRRALPLPAAGHPGQRGRRQRRSAGAAAGGGGHAGLRVRRPARMPVDAGPGGDLSGLRPQVERGHRGHRRGPGRRARRPPAAGAGPSARHALRRRQATGARGRVPVRARRRRRRRGAGLPGRRPRVLPPRGPRLRGRTRPATGGHPPDAAAREARGWLPWGEQEREHEGFRPKAVRGEPRMPGFFGLPGF